MSVDGSSLADGTYRCEAVLNSNAIVTLGKLTVAAGSGWWNGPLDVNPNDISVVRVIAANGDVVATAGLNRAESK